MKKILSCLLVVVILLGNLTIMSFAVVENKVDERTGLKYEMHYYTQVYGTVGGVEYDSKIDDFYAGMFREMFHSDISSSEVQKSIANCDNQFTPAVANVEPGSKVIVHFSFLDGYKRELESDDKSVPHILKYFGISKTLSGEKTVVKQGIPFTFSGDGKGKLWVEVRTNEMGTKNIKIELPVERSHWKERKIDTKYNAYYTKKGEINAQTIEFSTLEEAIDECAKNADSNRVVRIEKETYYDTLYYAKVSDIYVLDVYYGWVDRSEYETTTKSSSNKTDTTKPSTSKTEKTTVADKTTETTTKTVTTTKVQNNTTETTVTTTILESTELETISSTTLKETEANAVVDNEKTETTGKDKNNAIPIIIGIAVVVVTGAVAIGVTVTTEKKKK